MKKAGGIRIRRAARGIAYTTAVAVGILFLLVAAAALICGAIALSQIHMYKKHVYHNIRSIGFSVYKNSTESVTDSTTTIIGGWADDNGFPAYDRAGTLFNLTSGIYTALKTARYLASATVCFAATANGTREARIVTSGTASMTAYARTLGDATITGDQCLCVQELLYLPKGEMVWVEAYSNSGNTETITTETRFGVERIATNG
jgi:hypothetical protein